MNDAPCLRCGHSESEHMNELQICDEFGCTCTGFVTEESLESEPEEVPELYLGEDGS